MNKPIWQILNGVDYQVKGTLADTISSITNNSNQCVPGSLFFAVTGTQTDGHRYIPQAIDKGAVAVVAEKYQNDIPIPQIMVKNSRAALATAAANYYNHPAKQLSIIGITGTNGKTTTVYLLNQIWKTAGFRRGTIGTIGYSIGEKFHSLLLTTPDALQLQGILAQMVAAKLQNVAMEVSAHALSLNRVDEIEFAGAVFTNISQDHLDFYKTMQNYISAKILLFNRVKSGGFRLINIDDRYAEKFEAVGNTALASYSIHRNADFRWSESVRHSEGINGLILGKGIEIPIRTKLSGHFNLSNILAAVATAVLQGIDPESIQRALAEIDHIPGRLQEIRGFASQRIFIDYAHTPDAIINVLKALRAIVPPKGKLIAVFGCGGDRDKSKRPLMAAAAGSLADLAILTTDNPRFEEPEAIIEDARFGFNSHHSFITIVDRKAAIRYALQSGGNFDIIAILGKGHENFQDIKGIRYPHNDYQTVKDIVRST
jgi:UDP-N-acetylmuramoyl-L-alanyl-D-glutamate--2,6-diaminopimelate ligase